MKRFSKRLRYALRGIGLTYKEEPNFKIHIALGVVAIAISWWVGLNTVEWLLLIGIILIVLILETINSIFERAIDMIKPTTNQYVKDMKDMMASSVLLGALFAIAFALLVLVPKIVDKLA